MRPGLALLLLLPGTARAQADGLRGLREALEQGQARGDFERALDATGLLRSTRSAPAGPLALVRGDLLLFGLERVEEAVLEYQLAVAHAPDASARALAFRGLAEARLFGGRSDAAREEVEAAVTHAEASGRYAALCAALRARARANEAAGRPVSSLRDLDRAFQAAFSAGDAKEAARARVDRAAVWAALGLGAEAVEEASKALAVLSREQLALDAARARRARGRAALAAGSLSAARVDLEAARDAFQAAGLGSEVARTLLALAELELAADRPAEARAAAARAAKGAETLGIVPLQLEAQLLAAQARRLEKGSGPFSAAEKGPDPFSIAARAREEKLPTLEVRAMVEQVETPAAAGRGVGPRDIARKALSLPGAEPWALELARHVGWEAVLELFHQRRRSLLDGVTDRSVTWLHRSHARFLDDVSSGGEDRGRLTVARLTEPLADALRLAQLRSLVVPLPFEPVAATRAPSPTSEAERTLAVLRTALTPETVRLVPSNVSQSPQITTFPLDEFGPFALIVDLPAPPGSRPEPAPSAEVRREFLVARPSAVVWLSNDGFQKALESRLLPVGQTVSKSRKIRRAFSFREAFASPSPPAGDGPVAIWAAPDDAKSLAPLYGDRALVRSTAAQFREDAPRAGVLHLDLPAELPPNGSPFEARLVFPDGGLSALELLALDLRKVRAAVLAREAPEGILRALLLKGCPAVAVPHGAGGAATRAAHLRALHEALAAGASLEEAYDRTRAAESFALYVGVGSGGG